MASIWEELKRRNVVKVTVAYAVVGWLVIEILTTVLPVFEAPGWIAKVFTFLVFLGFPIVVILSWAYELTPDGVEKTSAVPSSASITRKTGKKLEFITIGALVVALLFVLFNYDFGDTEQTTTVAETSASVAESDVAPANTNMVRRFALTLGDFKGLGPGAGAVRAELALSPDGSHLAYIARIGDDPPRLFVRALDQFEPKKISGTQNARRPFFSPDGEWIGFDSGAGTELQVVSVQGGSPRMLTSGHNRMYGATWSTDGTIVFSTASPGNNLSGKLVSLPAGSEEPQDLLVPGEGTAYTWPHFLPDGESLLFTVREADGFSIDGSIALLSLNTGAFRTLIAGAYNAKYSPTGHIIYARADTLWAVPFDVDTLEITGPESPLFDGIQYNSRLGDVIYDFSDDGLLVYLLGSETYDDEQENLVPVWVDRDGIETESGIEPKPYAQPRISPDGRQMSVSIFSGVDWDIWTIDLESGKSSRLTFGASDERDANWTPDGERLIHASSDAQGGVFSKQANGAGLATVVSQNDIAVRVGAITPDGERLVLLDQMGGESDMYLHSVFGESYPQPFMLRPFDDDFPDISPDGKYIAYESNETTRDEIYVRAFPDLDGGKWQVSIGGGVEPRWNSDGSELFFHDGLAPNSTIFVADVTTSPTFAISQPRILIPLNSWLSRNRYDVSPDDQRFLILKNVDAAQIDGLGTEDPARLAVVENWFEELKRITPATP